MISNHDRNHVPCDGVFVVSFFKTMYNKTIIRFGFCDIRNNQGLGKCYQFRPFGSADNILFYLDLDYSGYHKNHIQYLFVVNIIIIMSLIIIISYYYYSQHYRLLKSSVILMET